MFLAVLHRKILSISRAYHANIDIRRNAGQPDHNSKQLGPGHQGLLAFDTI